MSNLQHRESHGGSMLNQLTPVVKGLLILNLIIYFADLFFFDRAVREFGAFSIGTGIYGNRYWELITFQFMHGSVGHVMMNGIGLFVFGPLMERLWGGGRFLVFYLACGVGGALFFTLLAVTGILPAMSVYTPLVGASAGIYGVLIAVAVLAPSLQITLIFPPITLTMRQLALGVLTIAVGIIVFRIGTNAGGEAGHLGGAIAGFMLTRWVSVFGLGEKKKAKRPRRHFEPKIRPRTVLDLRAQSEVDAILEKISREGFQSLTDEERDLLHRSAKNQQD
jgi:membrane associated rhomboid family serine protease